MITEDIIEGNIEFINGDTDLAILDFVQKEKDFSAYLLGDDFHLLSDNEKETLLFVHVVLHKSMESLEEDFDAETFQEIEEKNWNIIDDKSKNWEEKVNFMFDGYAEEDLLAFTEDMINDDDISQLAKELIFVTAKSYIDLKTEI